MNKNRLYTYVINMMLSVILAVSLWILIKPLGFTFWPDFNIYHHSAQSALHAVNPYLSHQIFVGGYLYPPISLLIFYPLALFPVVTAGRLWIVISVLCLFLALWLLLWLYNSHKNFLLLCVVGILVCNYFPVKFTLGMGQLNTVILLLVVLALIALQKNNKTLAGIFFGITLSLKYFPILIFAYMLVRRKWNTLLASIITIIILFGAGVFSLGKETTLYYFQHILFGLATSTKVDYYNQALSGFLLRGLPKLPILYIALLRISISLGMIIATAWVMRHKQNSQKMLPLEIGIWITLTLLLNSFSWQHQFVLLLIPLLVTFFTLKQNVFPWKLYIPLFLSYLLVAINMKNPSSFPVVFQSHVFYGAFILWLLDLYILSSAKK